MVCDNHDAKGNHEKTDDHHVWYEDKNDDCGFTLSWLAQPVGGCETLHICWRDCPSKMQTNLSHSGLCWLNMRIFEINSRMLEFDNMSRDSPNNTKEENADIVSQLVGKESNQGGSDEDTERQNRIPEVRLNIRVKQVFWQEEINLKIICGWIQVCRISYMRAMSTSLMPISFMWMVR